LTADQPNQTGQSASGAGKWSRRQGETNAHHQLEQTDGTFFDDGEDQRRQDGEATRIKRKVGGQERTEAILRRSVPGVVHRRKQRTGTDFSALLQTFDP